MAKTSLLVYGTLVDTPDGPASVIKDCRIPCHGDPAPHDTIWVLLTAGDNPQPYICGLVSAVAT